MRMIGKIESQQNASRFADYAQSLGISIQAEEDGEEFALWNLDDDHLEKAKAELQEFKENPEDPKYAQGASVGRKVRDKAEKEQRKRAQNIIHARRGWEKPLLNQCPVTLGLIMLSILTVVFTSSGESFWHLGDKENELLSKMRISEVQFLPGNMIQYSDLSALSETYEFWRLFTPMFLHFSFLHILFNMMWTKDLGPVIEHRIGSFRFLVLVLFISATSNIGQFYWSGPMFGGMSGVVFGLFGFIWMRGKFDPKSGFYIPKELLVFLGIFQLLCLLGTFRGIANAAHMVGLAAGMAVGAGIPLLKKALK